MKIKVISSSTILFESSDVAEVYAPATIGIIGILPGHDNYLSTLEIGTLKIKEKNGREEKIVLNGGLIQVQDDEVTVLADEASMAEDLLSEEIENAIKNAEKQIAGKLEPSELIKLEKMLKYEKFKKEQVK